MEHLQRIEDFVELGFELGLFIIVVTLAMMQAIAPYVRTVVQKLVLRQFHGDFSIGQFLASVDEASHSLKRYPALAQLGRGAKLHFNMLWDRSMFSDRSDHQLLAQVPTGVSHDLVMRVVQNIAQSIVDRPFRDLDAFAALTCDADKTDQAAAIMMAMLDKERPNWMSFPAKVANTTSDEREKPSQLASEVTAVRTNLAEAAERKLDQVQIAMTVKWQSLGRLLAVAVGVSCAVLVALFSRAITTPILLLAALAPVAFVVVFGSLSNLTKSRWQMGRSEHLTSFARAITIMWDLHMAPLLPLYGLVIGIIVIESLSAGLGSVLVVGALAGLIASLIYDTARAVVRKR